MPKTYPKREQKFEIAVGRAGRRLFRILPFTSQPPCLPQGERFPLIIRMMLIRSSIRRKVVVSRDLGPDAMSLLRGKDGIDVRAKAVDLRGSYKHQFSLSFGPKIVPVKELGS